MRGCGVREVGPADPAEGRPRRRGATRPEGRGLGHGSEYSSRAIWEWQLVSVSFDTVPVSDSRLS